MEYTNNIFERGTKYVMYLFAALLPLWFIPRSVGIEFGREVTFGILIILAAILWLLSLLARGEIRYQRSLIFYAGLLMLVVYGVSTFFSAIPMLSLFAGDAASERVSTLIGGFMLMMLAGSVMKSRADSKKFLYILIFSGAVSALLTSLRIILATSLYTFISPLATGIDFNVIGTINGLAIFYAVLFIMALGIISVGSDTWKPLTRALLIASIALFSINLLVINFRMAWILLLGGAIVLFGLSFKNTRSLVRKKMESGTYGTHRSGFGWRSSLAIGLVVFSIVMLTAPSQVFQRNDLPAEVSPSLSATMQVAKSVFNEGIKNILLGSGPATFGYDWGRFKDPSINQTLFWGVRFNQGFSWIATIIPTVGVLGTLATLMFLFIASGLFLKKLLLGIPSEYNESTEASVPERGSYADPLSMGAFLGTALLLIAAFLYPANLSLILLLFLLSGILSSLLSTPAKNVPEKNIVEDAGLVSPRHESAIATQHWLTDIQERVIIFETPWVVFVSSLATVFLLSISVSALYLEIGRLRGAFIQSSAIEALNKGDTERAIILIQRAIELDKKNSSYQQSLVQARIEKIKTFIARASRGENLQQEFQSTVAMAIQNSQTAVQTNEHDPLLWKTQGELYETLIPFVDGAERFAIGSYTRAIDLDPRNPSFRVDRGRAELVFADRIRLLVTQARDPERGQLDQKRTDALKEAEKDFTNATELKPDFAQAHFLLAQTSLRLGDARAAIQNTENTKRLAPFDIGVAFQLALLYYQTNDIARAEEEFIRATSINSNYSNARYFLGLIYDRKGDKERAIAEFEKVKAFNPDNQEVERILANLRAGKSALDKIVPPAEAPEKRKETPVKEGETRKR